MITAAGVVEGLQREESLHSCAWRGRGKNGEGGSHRVK